MSITRATRRVIRFKAKAVLCCILTLNLHMFLPGCGQLAGTGDVLAFPQAEPGWTRIPLPAGHPLHNSLAGTAFARPTAIDIHPPTSQFRLIYVDSSRDVTGQFAYHDQQPVIETLRLKTADGWITFALGHDGRVTNIATSTGHQWEPKPLDGARINYAYPASVEHFVNANQQLFDEAQYVDNNALLNAAFTGPTPSGPIPPVPCCPDVGAAKEHSGLFFEAIIVFSLIVQLVNATPFVVHSLVTVFIAASAIQDVLALRFNGIWDVSSLIGSQAGFRVVIEDGRIEQVFDAQGTELMLLETRLDSALGIIRWWVKVTYQAAGSPVYGISFELAEQSDGTLDGQASVAIGDSEPVAQEVKFARI